MSPGARWAMGIVLVGAAAMFVWLPAAGMIPANPWIAYVLGAVCLGGAVACLPGRAGRISGRFVAGAVALYCVSYLVYEIANPGEHRGRSSDSLPNAIRLFLLIGLPSGIYAAVGRRGVTAD